MNGGLEFPTPVGNGLTEEQVIEGTQFVPPPIPITPTNRIQQVRVAVLNYEPTVPSEGNQTLWQIFHWNDPRVERRSTSTMWKPRAEARLTIRSSLGEI